MGESEGEGMNDTWKRDKRLARARAFIKRSGKPHIYLKESGWVFYGLNDSKERAGLCWAANRFCASLTHPDAR